MSKANEGEILDNVATIFAQTSETPCNTPMKHPIGFLFKKLSQPMTAHGHASRCRTTTKELRPFVSLFAQQGDLLSLLSGKATPTRTNSAGPNHDFSRGRK